MLTTIHGQLAAKLCTKCLIVV